MGTQTVSYFSTAKLNCGDCGAADVILCVPSSLVAPKACAGEGDTTYAYRFIEAELILVEEVDQGCNGIGYNYTFTYDDTQVEQNLVSGNIQGVLCKGCLTTYIEDIKGNDVTVTFDAETSTYTLINEHGCEFEIVAGGGGVTYTFSDTNSINLTLTGTTVTADVNISADVGNVLEERVNGLYVPTGGGAYTFSDTNSVNLTLTGSDVTADVKISADAGNIIVVEPDGVFAPPVSNSFNFTSWTPTVTPEAPFIVNSVTINQAKYIKVGTLFVLSLQIYVDITGGNFFYVSLPPGITFAATPFQASYCDIYDIPGLIDAPGRVMARPPIDTAIYISRTNSALALPLQGWYTTNATFEVDP